ncbi:VOC family protein [Pontivivens ytuae]|uniref:Glyoxalase n=1 Tax=Pontivivens ytuae TaxID=2789856 RepID=A0A7S9LVH5_9RHOB|nr:VOC family protein [Pontivivens ytuae]QPH55735.1 glyoxalase [Pontivivens ytuae]
MRLDHLQLAIPAGSEPACRTFWTDLIGLPEIEKPEPLRDRGGLWLRLGDIELHLGVDPDFTPATKAHPALAMDDIDRIAARLTAAGHAVTWDDALPDRRRFFTADPVGNRIEVLSFR